MGSYNARELGNILKSSHRSYPTPIQNDFVLRGEPFFCLRARNYSTGRTGSGKTRIAYKTLIGQKEGEIIVDTDTDFVLWGDTPYYSSKEGIVISTQPLVVKSVEDLDEYEPLVRLEKPQVGSKIRLIFWDKEGEDFQVLV